MLRRYEWVESQGLSIYSHRSIVRKVESTLGGLGFTVSYTPSLFTEQLGYESRDINEPDDMHTHELDGVMFPRWLSSSAIGFVVHEGDIDDDVTNFNIYTEEVSSNHIGFGISGLDSWAVFIDPARRGQRLSDYFYLLAETNQRLMQEIMDSNAMNYIKAVGLGTTRTSSQDGVAARTTRRLVQLGYSPATNGGSSWVLG